MPDGKLGKMVSGRLIPLLCSNQKQRGHSFIKDKELGDNL